MSENKVSQKRICPVSRKCGGCQLMNLSYPEQLKFKQEKIDKVRACLAEFVREKDD